MYLLRSKVTGKNNIDPMAMIIALSVELLIASKTGLLSPETTATINKIITAARQSRQ